MRQVREASVALYRELLAEHRGSAAAAFAAAAAACVRRFVAQNGRERLPEDLVERWCNRLWQVAERAGWPRPLAPDEKGTPRDMAAAQVEELIAQVFADLPHPERHADLAVAARQLLKACLNPEFRQCRESYREVVDGVCRRQDLTRARGRISGTHCVDCPYWTSLAPAQHAALLEREWVEKTDGCTAHRAIFLPEDFRRLRILVWGRLREQAQANAPA